MEDKEVGELWNTPMLMPTRKYVECLIRKLVEGRAQFYCETDWHFGVPDALGDFGIDPKTWKETK